LTAAGIVLRAPHELEMVLVVETSDFVRAIVRPAAAASRLGEWPAVLWQVCRTALAVRKNARQSRRQPGNGSTMGR